MIKRLQDQSGASIVIALLFFLICLAVGGIVVAAASAGAGTVPREKQSQQAEYDVGCAAQTFADQMASCKVTVVTNTVDDRKSFVVTQVEGTALAREFWAKQSNMLFGNYAQGQPTTFSDLNITGNSKNVRGTLTFDANLNMTAKMGLDGSDAYQMTVYLQAVPKYDFAGRLRGIEYEAPVIQKTSDAPVAGGA